MSIRHGMPIGAYGAPSAQVAAAATHATAPAGDGGSRAAAPPAEPTAPRSPISQAAMTTVFVGTGVKTGLDFARIAKKLPEAFSARTMPLPADTGSLMQRIIPRGIREAIHGTTGRLPQATKQLLLVAPDTRIIDPRAPLVASESSAMRSFSGVDRTGYRWSSVLGAGLAGIQLGSSIPNLYEALSKEGPAGLYNSKSGRSGVLQALGGGIGVSMIGAAFLKAPGGGGFVSRLVRAAESPVLTSPMITNIGIGSALLVGANELGFFDFMDKGNTRSVGEVFSDAAGNLPFL